VPTLDDELLDTLLHHAGDSFPVPPSGPSAILRRVLRDDVERAGLGHPSGESGESGEPAVPAPLPLARTVRRRVLGTVRAHKVLSVAASVLILFLVAGGVALRAPGTPKSTAGLKAAPATHSPGSRYGVVHQPSGSGKSVAPAPSTGSTAGSNAAAPAVPSATGTSSKATDATNAPNFQSTVVGQPARIEQTGSLDLTVSRGALSSTVARLTALATANDGFVASSQTAANDVTGQYNDLQDRITALEASRQQYLTIMTKASSIGDVLAVQAQLDSLQSQLEQLQGQLAALGSETDYSKVTTVVSEAGLPHHHPATVGHSGLGKAWHDSVHGFVAGAEGLVRIAGPALFALLCLGALLLGGQIFWRRLQRHNL
jgi:hypothetical protein